MARTRAEREADFRAIHGVSSGTYYEMRRKAQAEGISGATFDQVHKASGYAAAKAIAIEARSDLDNARYDALVATGLIPKGTPRPRSDAEWDDIYDQYDIPDDYDWWYH